MLARSTLLSLLTAVLLMAGPLRALAQEESTGASFVTPFPAGDVYTLQVIGDDLAEGMLFGLLEAFGGDSRVQIRPKAYSMNGLLRPDFAEKLVQLDEDLKNEPVHIAVVMMGAWDRVSVRDENGRRAQIGSQPWKAEYSARADRLMKQLKKRNVAVYWVGLPNMRRNDANLDSQMMNDLLRERIYLNGMKYIDAYAGFIDETGGFSAHGPDVTGKIRLLRFRDGVFFTSDGNRKLAHFVERDLRRDLTQAKSERAIPLAGTEAEQAKINPDKEKIAAAEQAAQATKKTPSTAAPTTGAAPPVPTADSTGDQKADNGRINLRMVSPTGREELVTLEIVRPAIPASVVALVTRRESPDKPSQLGEAVVDQIPGGLTVMNTVAMASITGASGGRRGMAPAQTPYFRVMFKGERLQPKRGRADDIPWPRPAAAVVDVLETGATAEPEPAPEQPVQARQRRRQ